MNKKKLFNDNWLFSLDENNPQKINLPHDWLIYDVNNLYKTGIGTYKKTFTIDNSLPNHFLRFNGVYMDCSIYINGSHIGDNPYGYTSFEFEITSYLKENENEVLVKVNYENGNSRWYTGAGIYRDVYLISTNKTYIPYNGVYISTKKNDSENKENNNSWSIEVDIELAGTGDDDKIEVENIIYYENEQVFTSKKAISNIKNNQISDTLNIKNPHLWGLSDDIIEYEINSDLKNNEEKGNKNSLKHTTSGKSKIYTLKTRIYKLNKPQVIIHEEENTFGFREIAFINPYSAEKETGLFLNGKKLKLKGVCQHHDLGALGAAFNKDALKRQFELLKEMGVNAIRTAHNPPDPYFMTLADEMGFLIVSELFDMWEKPKTPKDYARFFKDWWQKDVSAWVKRDRNHPSLALWSIGNEIHDTHSEPIRAGEVLEMLVKEVQKYDSKNNAFITIGSNYLPWENTQKVVNLLPEPKLIGYNYGEYLYKEHHEKYKDWIIYGSETGSVVQSRGIYHFPLKQSVLADDDEQCSSLGNSATSWGAKSTQSCIITDRDTPFSLGQFIWTGTDYIGEPTPYHTKNSYFGQIDTAGFKKDSFYIYKAAWQPMPHLPPAPKQVVIHIFPYWDFSPGQKIDVQVVSNAPKIELFFNGVSKGTFNIDHKNGDKLIGTWQIPYEKGELVACAYDENGTKIAEDRQKSFGETAKLETKETQKEELSFIEIYAVDTNGTLVHNANNRVNIKVKSGELLGLDNGDSTDYDQYKGTSKRLFSGKLLAITTKGTKLEIELDKDDIPIRKIELIKSNDIDKQNNIATIKAVIHPLNASYKDLQWRVTDAAGIDTNLASFTVSEDSTELKLTAKGDGEIFVRCATKNGREKISLISYLDFEVSGLGKAYIEPYSLVAGGLYNKSNLALTNGNERGVATLRDGESHVGFADIDFGDIGADEIHLPIFAMSDEQFPIEIWEGMPLENGEKLTEVIYKSGSIWNTYTTETYKLPRKLKGVTTICFVVRKKIHIKGFWFTKEEKAYQKLKAIEFTNIYGDTYEIKDEEIKGIGNNVTIEFTGMNFSNEKVTKLLINGRSKVHNTIHLKFDGEQTAQILEFEKTDDYVTKEFNINTTGKEKISFVFLPGSNFDFKWFQFSVEKI
ncbi:MAG: DUF4982 domain-containing protein [Defluviitaleaceae bacterium]|nr:DUF4982 domain-containing protein [Defluviitaleaceae bacterium]